MLSSKAGVLVLTLALVIAAAAPLTALAAGNSAETAVEPVQDPRINMLTYPVFGCPVIQAGAERFSLVFDTTNWGALEPSSPTAWHVSMVTSNDPVPLLVDLEVVSWSSVGDGIYQVEVEIPPEAPVDLFDLQVTCDTEGGSLVDSQPHAVKVIESFDDDLTFINLTDTQTGDILSVFNNLAESTPNWWPFAAPSDYWKHLRKAVDQINLIHPDFVIMSGDIVYGQLYFGEYPLEYPITHDILQGLDVPVFMCPGNHDGYVQAECDGEMYFQRYFAPLRYSFDYGPVHFAAANTYDWPDMDRAGYCLIVSTWGGQIGAEQLAWLDGDLEENAESDMRIVFCHHSPDDPSGWDESWWTIHDNAEYPYPQLYWRLIFGLIKDQSWVGDGREEMLQVLENRDVDMLLAGHVHYDRIAEDIFGPDTTDVVITTAGCFDLKAGSAYPGYRMIEIEDGEVTGTSYKDYYSIPIYVNGYPPADNLGEQTEPAILHSFANPNDGSSTTNILTVDNRLDMAVPVYVEFVMPAGTYQVSGGSLEQTSQRGGNVVVYVTSSVGPGGTLEVSINPQ